VNALQSSYQQRLHQNLVFLATIADSQPGLRKQNRISAEESTAAPSPVRHSGYSSSYQGSYPQPTAAPDTFPPSSYTQPLQPSSIPTAPSFHYTNRPTSSPSQMVRRTTSQPQWPLNVGSNPVMGIQQQPPSQITPENIGASDVQERPWTHDENRRFMDALRVFGLSDIEKITHAVQTRTTLQVQVHIQKYVHKLRQEHAKKRAALQSAQPSSHIPPQSHTQPSQHSPNMSQQQFIYQSQPYSTYPMSAQRMQQLQSTPAPQPQQGQIYHQQVSIPPGFQAPMVQQRGRSEMQEHIRKQF